MSTKEERRVLRTEGGSVKRSCDVSRLIFRILRSADGSRLYLDDDEYESCEDNPGWGGKELRFRIDGELVTLDERPHRSGLEFLERTELPVVPNGELYTDVYEEVESSDGIKLRSTDVCRDTGGR